MDYTNCPIRSVFSRSSDRVENTRTKKVIGQATSINFNDPRCGQICQPRIRVFLNPSRLPCFTLIKCHRFLACFFFSYSSWLLSRLEDRKIDNWGRSKNSARINRNDGKDVFFFTKCFLRNRLNSFFFFFILIFLYCNVGSSLLIGLFVDKMFAVEKRLIYQLF